VLANVRALAQSHDVGVFGLYSDAADQEADSTGFVASVSRQFTPEVIARLGPTSLEWLREADGHPSDRWYTDRVMSELSSFVTKLGAALVVVESLWLHRYIAPLRALGCRVVLDAHGIEAVVHEELADSNPTPLARKVAQRTRNVEATAFLAADQVWVPSAHDAAVARKWYSRSAGVAIIPNAIDLTRYSSNRQRSERFTVAYTASFGYPPNVAASQRLLDRIFPALRRRVPDARLDLIGRNPTVAMRAAAEADERINVTGTIDDVSTHLRTASAMAVPLVEGHGTRFKVLEAFASRLPVVSTRKGVEGIDAEAGEHYLAAESDDEFVDTLARLAAHPELGDRLLTPAYDLVRARYSVARVNEIVTDALATNALG
jgi:glycosyltransferase involved in cell wall biosynthesis